MPDKLVMGSFFVEADFEKCPELPGRPPSTLRVKLVVQPLQNNPGFDCLVVIFLEIDTSSRMKLIPSVELN